jgi:ATPase subunit of ABC transporter with duplicated ATPase domains
VAQFIYTMRKVRKAVGDKLILDDVTLSFLPGAKIGVVGPNGAGKSTVLRIMAGLDQPSNGDAQLSPGYSVGLLEQEPSLDETKTVRENVEDAVADLRATMARFEEVSVAMGEPDADFDALLTEQGNLMEKIEHANGWELDSRIEQAMDALRCPPGDEPVTHLSGGERRRVALCRLLLEQPDLLLLDEPTNHLDAESVQWLEQHLAKYPGTILAVTHDRYFLDNVAEWILELDRGRAYPYEGNYSTYLEKKADRLEVAGKRDQKLQKRLREWTCARTRADKPKQGSTPAIRGDGRRGGDPQTRLARFRSRPVRARQRRCRCCHLIRLPVADAVKDLSFSCPAAECRHDQAERGWVTTVQDDRGQGSRTQ